MSWAHAVQCSQCVTCFSHGRQMEWLTTWGLSSLPPLSAGRGSLAFRGRGSSLCIQPCLLMLLQKISLSLCTGLSKKKALLFDISHLAAAGQSDQPMHSQSAKMEHLQKRFNQLMELSFARPCKCIMIELETHPTFASLKPNNSLTSDICRVHCWLGFPLFSDSAA